jgi:hypothetical protein
MKIQVYLVTIWVWKYTVKSIDHDIEEMEFNEYLC